MAVRGRGCWLCSFSWRKRKWPVYRIKNVCGVSKPTNTGNAVAEPVFSGININDVVIVVLYAARLPPRFSSGVSKLARFSGLKKFFILFCCVHVLLHLAAGCCRHENIKAVHTRLQLFLYAIENIFRGETSHCYFTLRQVVSFLQQPS